MVKKSCFTILLRTFFKKKDKNKVFFEGSSFSLLFYSLPFKKSIFANKHLFYQIYRWVSLSLLQKLFRILTMNFSRFFVFFLTQVFLILFSSLFFVFVHHVSLSPLFFISFSFDLFIFLISLLLELSFFEQQFPLPFVKKTLQLFLYFMHALPLYDHLLIDLFICCLFFSLRFLPFLSHLFPFSFFCFLSP